MSALGIDVGRHFDVVDSVARWTLAEVIDVDRRAQRVKVSFSHWPAKYDTWIDVSERTIAPLGTHIYMKGGVLKEGQRIEVYDEHPTQKKWIEAFVIDCSRDKVKVTFKNWAAKVRRVYSVVLSTIPYYI